MKKTAYSLVSVVLLLACVFCFVSCGRGENTDLWASATYQTDAELGTGSKTVTVKVQAQQKTVAFTIHTDAETLGDALLTLGLISGEPGDYGMYIKQVNGITADYDVDRSYWGFYKLGEYMMTGVDATVIADGDCYELVYTK